MKDSAYDSVHYGNGLVHVGIKAQLELYMIGVFVLLKQNNNNLEFDIFMRLPLEAVKRKYLKDLDVIKEIKLSADENFVYCGKQCRIANGDWKKLASRAFLFKTEGKSCSLIFITLIYGTRNQFEQVVYGRWSAKKEFDDWLTKDGDSHD